jgi:hypothetical protein
MLPCEENSNAARYFRQQKYRHLLRDPICKECLKLGIERKATDVAHNPPCENEYELLDAFRYISLCPYHYRNHMHQARKALKERENGRKETDQV